MASAINVSSAMICWNEAQTIDLALKSIKGFTKEVIVIDTGSFDGTQKIVKELLDELDLSGELASKRVKNLGEARLEAFMKCSGKWVLIQDSNLVLSSALKEEIKRKVTQSPNKTFAIESLNLMGDYHHYFANRPFMAPHKIFVKRRKPKWTMTLDRPHIKGARIVTTNWAVNLSRVRPSWRIWLRGEPFDRKHYTDKTRLTPEGYINPSNHQWHWMNSGKHYSPLEYAEEEMNTSFDEVKKIAPEWFLRQLKLEARPLEPWMEKRLPEVIMEERLNPRYKLIYENGEIQRRFPEL